MQNLNCKFENLRKKRIIDESALSVMSQLNGFQYIIKFDYHCKAVSELQFKQKSTDN